MTPRETTKRCLPSIHSHQSTVSGLRIAAPQEGTLDDRQIRLTCRKDARLLARCPWKPLTQLLLPTAAPKFQNSPTIITDTRLQ